MKNYFSHFQKIALCEIDHTKTLFDWEVQKLYQHLYDSLEKNDLFNPLYVVKNQNKKI